MSEFQERLQKIGGKQIALLRRFAIIVHNDLLRLGRVARQVGDAVFTPIAKRISSLARRGDLETQSGDRAVSLDPHPVKISSDNIQRVTRAPDGQCIYAIGDIHGRCDLLSELLDKIDADAADLPSGTDIIVIFLGDYIDRGLQSRQVIDLLMSDRLQAYQTVFLMGNHEESLLRFREMPEFGREWARFGGGETLFSYGVQPPQGRARNAAGAWQPAWEQFRENFPDEHLEFYQNMTHYITIGDYFFVHAGLRPDVAIKDQTVEDMLWIRDAFLSDQAPFPYLVVHGHSVTHTPFLDDRRMGLDTGAFSTGILSAGKFFETSIEVIATG